jgi:hypothetical protein
MFRASVTLFSAVTLGLWQKCTSGFGDGMKCTAAVCGEHEDFFTNSCGPVMAARAFITLVCIVSAISTVCLIKYARKGENADRNLLVAGRILLFVCFIMGIIGVAIGINATTGGVTSIIGAAGTLGIIAIITNFGGAVASVLIGMHQYQQY